MIQQSIKTINKFDGEFFNISRMSTSHLIIINILLILWKLEKFFVTSSNKCLSPVSSISWITKLWVWIVLNYYYQFVKLQFSWLSISTSYNSPMVNLIIIILLQFEFQQKRKFTNIDDISYCKLPKERMAITSRNYIDRFLNYKLNLIINTKYF